MSVLLAVAILALGMLLPTFVSSRLQRRASAIANKRDVLRRLVGHRYALTSTAFEKHQDAEPFVALNEAVVVYADRQEVLSALRMFRESVSNSELQENLIELIGRMAAAARVPHGTMHKELLRLPFNPGRTRIDLPRS